jgi:hypothetical protein
MNYQRLTPPAVSNVQELLDYCAKEFQALQDSLNSAIWELPTSYKAPDKLRAGMIVLADGTEWNPGSGAGFYGYYGGSWHKLG